MRATSQSRTRFLAVFTWAAIVSVSALGETGLVARWTFDRDFSSETHGRYYDGRAAGTGDIAIDDDPGAARIGRAALRLNAKSSAGKSEAFVFVGQPLVPMEIPATFTVTGWFKALPGTKRGTVWSSMPNTGFAFGIRTDDDTVRSYFRFRTYDVRIYSDGPVSFVSTPPSLRPEHTTNFGNASKRISAGEWHHSALVWNAADRHLRNYLDGKLVHETRLPPNVRLEPARGLHIGSSNISGNSPWRGWIDEIAVFDVELTPRQIRALADARHDGAAVDAGNVLARVNEPAQRLGGQWNVPALPAADDASQGPALGHVDAREAIVWARLPRPGTYRATARSEDAELTVVAESGEENDWTMKWTFRGLRPETMYKVSFDGKNPIPPITFRTAIAPGAAGRVQIGFGSCAEFPDSSIWSRIAENCPDGLVMLGDTPYIDNTELQWQRWAHRRFASIPQLAHALKTIPSWSVWDDHDFGTNNGDGNMPGKGGPRKAFMEYRANRSAGENGEGIYTSFRRGPVEVFLLDTRWFANTEPSWADPKKLTTLGRAQWAWLQKGLLGSDATFKVIAAGVIWDRKPHAPAEDAFTAHEREAIIDWLGANKIRGVVLVGGDIHRSRIMKYDTVSRLGYDLRQFITSPMNERVSERTSEPSPTGMLTEILEPYVFMRLTGDTNSNLPTLQAEWYNRDGKLLMEHRLDAHDLGY